MLQSAIQFLAGEFLDQPDDFVPYVEFKTNLHIYQWIGAGRDSDQHLKQLCEYWLTRRSEMGIKLPVPPASELLKTKHTPTSVVSMIENRPNLASERAVSPPPPPRCPTTWIVKKATPAEIVEFREQERKRFEHPDRAFTYRMHRYESVVGPVKGIYTQIPAMTKARGHNMLTQDRPSFVTILTLVRDATARLPNGEGTRTEICELLKSSQYICPSATDTVLHSIVSGALDRMHTENDPCVRYESKRKIWIYLHRNRTEEEFEMMHQQFQGVSKHKKQINRKTKIKTCTPKITDNSIPTENVVEAADGSDEMQLLVSTSSTLSPSSANIPQITLASMPIITTPQKKVTIKTIPSASTTTVMPNVALALASTNTQQSKMSSKLQTTQSPIVISSMNSLPLPALSSINASPLSTNPPPLINKVITTQKKVNTTTTAIKPVLVPIQSTIHESSTIDTIDIDHSNLESSKAIIISKSPAVQNTAQITGIVLDKNQKGNTKIIGKSSMTSPTSAITAQIKVSTASGFQTIHVSPGHPLIKSQSQQQSVQPTLLQTNVTNQQINLPNHIRRPQQQLVTTKAIPPLIAAQSPANHSYVIPISIGKNISGNINKTIQPIIAQTVAKSSSAKPGKTSTVPALTNVNSSLPRTVSLLQTQGPQIVAMSGNKTIIRTAVQTAVPAGKSLINPSLINPSIVTNRQQQQQPTMQIIQTKPLQQQNIQNIIVSPNATNAISGTSKARIVGTASPIMVQKIIAVSKSSTSTSNIIATTTPSATSICNVNTIRTTTNQASTSLISQPNSSEKSPTTTAKVQTISTAKLSPLQQQSIFGLNKQIRVVQSLPGQSNLIIKPTQQMLTQIQKQLPAGQQIQLANVQATSSILDGQLQSVTSTTTSSTITQPIISRPIAKAVTSLIPTPSTTNTISSSSPIIGKVITDESGQIISLENLVHSQKQVRTVIAGSKPNQTNFIQLAGTPGSQIAQYAVVSSELYNL